MSKKKSSRFKKISWKLTIFYGAVFSIILIALSLGIIFGIRYYLIRQAMDQVQSSCSITVDEAMDKLSDQDTDKKDENRNRLADPELLNEASANTNVDVAIADGTGYIVSQSGNLGLSVTSDLNVTREVSVDGNQYLVRNTDITSGSQVLAYIQITLNLANDYSFLRVIEIAVFFADVIGVFLSLVIGNLMSKRMLKPIDNITKTAQEISISDLKRKIEIGDSDDELSRLANTFNEMIERLRVSFEKQNSFVSDASHELRTPIAVIRGYIDMMDRWGKNDKSILDESIAAIQNEIHNMGGLVEKLLFLARSDTGGLSISKENFDLYTLVNEIKTEYGLVYPERILKAEIKKNTITKADRSLIKQALRALVDNGIKYSPEGGEIIIASEIMNHEIHISVRDSGIGIPPEKIGSIFERFYRVDSARERESGGTGLGLSIVQTIVDVHRGRIQVESEPGKGTSVTIILPENTSCL